MFRVRLSMALAGFIGFAALPVQAFERLSESAFQAQVVGKTLHYARGGSLTFLAGGTLTGTFPKGAARGVWVWDGGKVCSQTTVAAKSYPRTCRSPEIDGNTIRFIANDGRVYGEATIK